MRKIVDDSSILITLTAVTLLLFHLSTRVRSADMKPCSHRFFKYVDANNNGSHVFDECVCDTGVLERDMLCPRLSSNIFSVAFFKNAPAVRISCGKPTENLNKIIGYFGRFFNLLNPRYFAVSNCCKEGGHMNCSELAGSGINILDLTTIPENEVVTKLSLSGNYITHISGSISLACKNLIFLSLKKNYLKYISNELLHGLGQLETLDVDNNKLEYLSNGTFFGLHSLQKLILSNNKITFIDENAFIDLVNLTYINLKYNHIQMINDNTFIRNTNLSTVVLSSNKLSEIPLIALRNCANLHTLDISNNCLSHSTVNLPPSFKIGNFLCTFCCLNLNDVNIFDKITTGANFTGNGIQTLNMELLKRISHLPNIDLSFNDIKNVDISWKYPAISMDDADTENRTTTLNFTSSTINCDCHLLQILHLVQNNVWQPTSHDNASGVWFNMNNVTCSKPKSLQGTNILNDSELETKLACDFLTGCPSSCTCYTIPYAKTNVINCIRSKLPMAPDVNIQSNMFFNVLHLENNHIQMLPTQSSGFWYKLKEVYLDDNKLTSLDGLTINPSLSILSFRNNNLTKVQPEIISLLSSSSVQHLYLSGNPWKCSCDLKDLKVLMVTVRKVVDYDKIMCVLDNGEMVHVLNSSDYTLCPIVGAHIHILYKTLLPIGSALLVFCSLFTIVSYKYKPVIKLWLFTHGYCLRLVTEDNVDVDKLFDAFVSYSSEDEEWVHNNLVTPMENGAPSYTFCLHNRNWIPGEAIMKQILRSVQCSRRTIIVLTESFVQSEWSRLEFEAAYQQALQDKVTRVLVVVPGELPDLKDLGPDLAAFITLNTYIKCSDDDFLQKLRCSMPRVRTRPMDINREIHDHFYFLPNNDSA